jgi:lysozyme
MKKITTPSKKILLFLEEFEEFISKPYLCPANVWSIGFGTTFYFDTKKRVTKNDKPITLAKARRLKAGHITNIFAPLVDKLCRDDLTQNEFDAVLSFVYNAGATYRSKTGSILYYNLFRNVNNKMSKNDLVKYWESLAITGGGKVLNGLKRRRVREVQIFNDNKY